MAALKAAALNIPDKENCSTPIAQAPLLPPPQGEQPQSREEYWPFWKKFFQRFSLKHFRKTVDEDRN
jgi:hypothetical protein